MIGAHYTSLTGHVIKQTNGHYLVIPCIKRKGLTKISREVVFSLLRVPSEFCGIRDWTYSEAGFRDFKVGGEQDAGLLL